MSYTLFICYIVIMEMEPGLDMDFLSEQFMKSAYLGATTFTTTPKVVYRTDESVSSHELDKVKQSIKDRLKLQLPLGLESILTLSKHIRWEWSINTEKSPFDDSQYFRNVVNRDGKISVSFHWDIDEILSSIDVALGFYDEMNQFSQEDISYFLKSYQHLQHLDLSVDDVKSHLKNLIPFISLWNGDYLCIHASTGYVHYLSHDPDDVVDGFGLTKIATDVGSFIKNIADVGYLIDLASPAALLSLYGQESDWRLIKNKLAELDVPEDFKRLHFTNRKRIFGLF